MTDNVYAFGGGSTTFDHVSSSNFQHFPDRNRELGLVQTSVLSRGALAKHLYEMRRQRENYLPAELFAEPAWDVLLLLYWAGDVQQRLSISAVCSSAGVPATTALRWIQKLVDLRMVKREAHPTDLRVSWLELTDDSKAAVDDYLSVVIHKSYELPH